jgi:hypothetical protein
VPYLVEGRVRFASDVSRAYEFLLSVNNRADVDNAIAGADLRLVLDAPGRQQMSLRIRSSGNEWKGAPTPTLQIPTIIGAHGTVQGWLCFVVGEEVFGTAQIDRYNVVLVDTHGNETIIEPILLKEYHGDEAAALAKGA